MAPINSEESLPNKKNQTTSNAYTETASKEIDLFSKNPTGKPKKKHTHQTLNVWYIHSLSQWTLKKKV